MASVGSLSSLGLGSDGALSYDIIDQLKSADESAMITPIDKDITQNSMQQSKLSLLTEQLKALKSSANTLASASTYLEKSTDISGSSANAVVAFGTEDQEINLDVVSLAQKDIYESIGYASDTAAIGGTINETVTFTYGSSAPFDVSIDSSMSLEEIAEAINTASGGDIEADVLNVGGANPYELIIKSKDTGAENAISFTSTGSEFATNFMNNITPAADAEFTYNGVTIHRASNTFDDLVSGVTLELKDEGATSITISKDKEKITETFNEFVSNYNSLMSDLHDYTKYDKDTQEAGIFQSYSQIRSIESSLKNVLMEFESGSGQRISDFGLSIDRDGTLELNASELETALSDDLEGMIELFSGTLTPQTDGFFDTFEDKIGDLVSGSDSVLGVFEDFLTNRASTLEDYKADAQERLDIKYEIMAKKFAAYDNMINQFNNSFSGLQSIIDQQNSSN
jgi:flagellar hook-associated protein 2